MMVVIDDFIKVPIDGVEREFHFSLQEQEQGGFWFRDVWEMPGHRKVRNCMENAADFYKIRDAIMKEIEA